LVSAKASLIRKEIIRNEDQADGHLAEFAAEQIFEMGTKMGTAINLTPLRIAVSY
jgi:hypothetical protein